MDLLDVKLLQMAPMKHGVGMYSATAVVVTVVFFAMPYLLGHDVSGGFSKKSIIRGAAKDDPKFPVSCTHNP